MSQTKGFRTANKRYMMIFVPMMTIYCVAITAALTLIDFDTSPIGLRVAAALSVSLPLVAILWSVLRLVRETDEYTRLRQLQALAEAGCLLTGTIFIAGILERFNVIGDVPLFLFGPAFFFFYGLAHVRQRLGKTV
jgi:hypothetical protein